MTPGSIAHRACGREETMEPFRCNYGLNPRYRHGFSKERLQITGTDSTGEVRIVELSDHPFFVATLFLPQLRSQPDAPHPLVLAFLAAASAFRAKA